MDWAEKIACETRNFIIMALLSITIQQRRVSSHTNKRLAV